MQVAQITVYQRVQIQSCTLALDQRLVALLRWTCECRFPVVVQDNVASAKRRIFSTLAENIA